MSTHNNKQRDRLKALLKELFQLDKPELDFGLYKIMHAKSQQITQFLDTDLLKEIEAAFGAESAGRIQQAEHKVAEAIDQAKKFGAPDPEAAPAVTEARAAYKLALEGGNTEAEIYDHLYRFFERYYDNGDFLSKRYYARENDSRAAPYSVPYDGREVYLHWANKDQYYIKSGEYLNNFSFDLTQALRLNREAKGQTATALDFGDATTDGPPLKVHMHLAQAQEGEHGNIKAAADQKREFIPLLSNPVAFNDQGELVLNFEYKVLPECYPIDSTMSAALMGQYDFKNKGDVPAHWMADVFLRALQTLDKDDTRYLPLLAEPVPTDTQKKRPLLAKYIQQYTARNTMDYFIHKDLGGFLRRELDFYIKNELMRLDDIENADAPRVEDYLGKIKALRRIAHQLIAFLAQMEDFQKKLWLKKKFVTETQYCITLDRVPESLYPAIAANDVQREEWVKLFAIDKIVGDTAQVGYSVPLSVDFLKSKPFLMVDTIFFADYFKCALLDTLHNIDNKTDGSLFHSENYQGLEVIKNKFNSKIKCIYIDPPYNTGDDGFAYKDNYKTASWLSMMSDRLSVAVNLIKKNGVFFGSIDERELLSFDSVLKSLNMSGRIISVKMSEASGLKMSSVAKTGSIPKYKEFLIAASKNGNRGFRFSHLQKNQWDSEYNKFIDGFELSLYDEIFSDDDSIKYDDNYLSKINRKLTSANFISVNEAYGKYSDGLNFEEWRLKNSWRIVRTAASSSVLAIAKESKFKQKIFAVISRRDQIVYLVDGNFSCESKAPRVQILFAKENLSQHPGDFWSDISTTGLEAEGGIEFKNGKKPLKLLNRIMELNARSDDLVLDFFSGSGTTFQSLIDLNSADGIRRKFIGMEQGEHFHDVLLKRLKLTIKSIFDGDSNQPNFSGYLMKYVVLESYEDTLNNLCLQTDPARNRALADNPALRQDYVLNYWLDVETQGSQSLLNLAAFRDPTAYTMRIKQPGSDVLREQRIDLIETFNWLIGLWVEHMAAPQTLEAEFTREVDPVLPKDQNTRLVCKRIKPAESGPYWFRLVEGYTLKVPGDDSSRQKTLVVWRKLTDDVEKDNAVLQHFLMEKLAISPREHTYAVIYVNGSHTLPNPVVEGEQTKVRLIEEAFHAAMWSQDGV